jgi:hypothetical protein
MEVGMSSLYIVGYDGSPAAEAALSFAGLLVAGSRGYGPPRGVA